MARFEEKPDDGRVEWTHVHPGQWYWDTNNWYWDTNNAGERYRWYRWTSHAPSTGGVKAWCLPVGEEPYRGTVEYRSPRKGEWWWDSGGSFWIQAGSGYGAKFKYWVYCGEGVPPDPLEQGSE